MNRAVNKARRSRIRIAVDSVMGFLFVAVMSTALVQEVPHEYLGSALFVLLAVHTVLNRRRLSAMFRGKNSLLRVLQFIAIVGLIVCVVGQIASSLVLSKYAFGFLPVLPGAAIARRLHMLCAYWGFVFAFAHVGLQFKGLGKLFRNGGSTKALKASSFVVWAARIAFVTIACYGVYSYVQLDLDSYLLSQVEFAFSDYSVPIALLFVRYASIGILIAGIFHYLRRAIE